MCDITLIISTVTIYILIAIAELLTSLMALSFLTLG